MQGNAGYEETRLLNDAVHELTRRLPPTWDTGLTDPRHSDRTDIYAVLSIRTPGGTEVEFLVEARWSTERAPVGKVLHQLLRFADGRPAVIITDYANPTLRTQCEAAGVGYIDTTGWVCLRNDDLGLFIREQGAAKSPVPPSKRGAAMSRLDGPGAGRVIRTLWGVTLPVGVRELAGAAGVVPSTAAKVLPTLASYGAIERSHEGAVTAVDRGLLIERWTQDYGIFTTNPEVRWLLSPRGPEAALTRFTEVRDELEQTSSGSTLTGWIGASAFLPPGVLPVIPFTLLAIHTENPEYLGTLLGLRSADPTTANVVLIRPRDAALLLPPTRISLAQVLADLSTMGGRFPELAEQLLESGIDDSRIERP